MTSVHRRHGVAHLPAVTTPTAAPVTTGKSSKSPDSFVHGAADMQLGDEGTKVFPGYAWKAADVDAVLSKFGIGDAHALIRTAIALDNGDRTLNLRELVDAGRKLAGEANRDLKWSPSTLAQVMTKTGVASETALLAEARRQDNGDRTLSRTELDAAARVLTTTLAAHDVADVVKRVEALRGKPGISVEKLGMAGPWPIYAIHFEPLESGKPAMRALVTGGVHGDEPCGPGAALLLVDQLLKNPAIRQDTAFTVVPMVNPRGLVADTRRTPEGIDLNRTFSHDEKGPEEVRNIGKLLGERTYDIALDLHSGVPGRNGFWALHRQSLDLLQPAVSRFKDHWPLLTGDPEKYEMSEPGIGESTNPSTLKDFAFQDGARWSVTLEAPGSLGYLDQVFGQNDLVNQILVEAHARLSPPAA